MRNYNEGKPAAKKLFSPFIESQNRFFTSEKSKRFISASYVSQPSLHRNFLNSNLHTPSLHIDVQAKNEETPLMLAVFERNELIVKVLLDNGARLEIKDNAGNCFYQIVL